MIAEKVQCKLLKYSIPGMSKALWEHVDNCPHTRSNQEVILRFLQKLLWYQYNTAPLDVFHKVYGREHHHSYITEKISVMTKSWLAWVGSLDESHRERLVDAILNKYPD